MSQLKSVIPPIVHVIAGLAPHHGGPSYSVPRLVVALRDAGVDARVMAVRDATSPDQPFVETYGASWKRIPLLRAMRLSPGLKHAIRSTASDGALIHAHGLWQMPTVYAGRLALKSNSPLIVAPRGMLAADALKFSATRKRLFWRLLQGPAFTSADCWHATSHAEAEDIRSFGVRAPIAVVPNGVDLPENSAGAPKKKDGRVILYLGRLHPKKGLPGLLRAWAVVAGDLPDWSLILVGPDENGHSAELLKLASNLNLPRFMISDAVYGIEKADVMAGADLFVLPTLNENFGIAVAEALAAGVPAIVSKGAPWSALAKEECGWWIDHGVEPLIEALRTATNLSPEKRRKMGERGRNWMARDFGWPAIAKEMAEVYHWVKHGGETPSTVLVD